MSSKYFCVVCTCIGLLMTGCGKSSSGGDGTSKLKTEEEAFVQFCTQHPNSQECIDINEEADQLGMDDYFGSGDDFFSDHAFGNSGVGCGCEYGERTIFYRGVPRCESEQIYQQVSRRQVSMRFVRRPNGKKKLWVAFDDSTSTIHGAQQDYSANDSCYEDFGARCRDDYDCQGMTDDYGYAIPASCEPIDGQVQYGYCQPRSAGQSVRF